jgi:hypothetical protein
VFAASVRISARLAYLRPQLARILTRTGLSYLISAEGLAPRALRDIRLAIDAGQFHVGNEYVALACAGGGLLGLLQLSIDAPGLVGDNAAEELAEQLLKMFGMPADTAHAIANRPLPEAVLP